MWLDVFDAPGRAWQSSMLPTPHVPPVLAVDGRYVLVTGGSDALDIYDLDVGQWTSGALSWPRRDPALAKLGTETYVAGGVPSDAVDIIDFSVLARELPAHWIKQAHADTPAVLCRIRWCSARAWSRRSGWMGCRPSAGAARAPLL